MDTAPCKSIVKYADHSKGLSCITTPLSLPVPPEHLFIKVLAAPIDLLDELISRGDVSGIPRPEPYPLGIEGAGVILEVGENVHPAYENCKGKKVAFYRGLKITPQTWGSWSSFAIVHHKACIILDESINCEEVADLATNGLTAYGMLYLLKKIKAKAALNTAAASSVGKKLLKGCINEGIDLICIVRKKESADILTALGAKYVLNQCDEKFKEDLKELCAKLGVTMGFDCVCGDLTEKLLWSMPADSTLYLYGNLGGPAVIQPKFLVIGDKTLKGFHVATAECLNTPEKLLQTFEQLAQEAKAGQFPTAVAKRYKLEQFNEALSDYKVFASKGKCIFTPHAE